MRLILLAGLVCFLAGCASVDLQILEPVDLSEKTVSMSAGGLLLTGELKCALKKDGWTVYAVDKTKEVTRGADETKDGERVVVYRESEWAKKARYHLVDRWETEGNPNSQIGTLEYRVFDVSLIDNKTGIESIILSGHGKSGKDIAQIFIDAVNGKEYDGWDRLSK